MGILGQQKPLATLSSTLLARKGQAKPAMRPQGFGGFGGMPGAHDDLGWNDMGHDADAPPSVPPVLVQREVLREEIAVPPVSAPPSPEVATAPETAPPAVGETVPTVSKLAAVKPVSVATATRLGRETGRKRGKAAFTLRLDCDRHLRLRIASALSGASAQRLVTEALDQYLQSLPEVDALVSQLPPARKR